MSKYNLWMMFKNPKEIKEITDKYNPEGYIPHITIEEDIKSFDKAMEMRRKYQKSVVQIKGESKLINNKWSFEVSLSNSRDTRRRMTISKGDNCDSSDYLKTDMECFPEIVTKQGGQWLVLTDHKYDTNENK
jgi:hypothetical protein